MFLIQMLRFSGSARSPERAHERARVTCVICGDFSSRRGQSNTRLYCVFLLSGKILVRENMYMCILDSNYCQLTLPNSSEQRPCENCNTRLPNMSSFAVLANSRLVLVPGFVHLISVLSYPCPVWANGPCEETRCALSFTHEAAPCLRPRRLMW